MATFDTFVYGLLFHYPVRVNHTEQRVMGCLLSKFGFSESQNMCVGGLLIETEASQGLTD